MNTIKPSAETYELIKRIAEKEGRTISAVLDRMLKLYEMYGDMELDGTAAKVIRFYAERYGREPGRIMRDMAGEYDRHRPKAVREESK